MPKKLWVEKYRPSTLDGFLFQSEAHQKAFEQYIEDKSIPHLLLKGHRGTGKTTLAFILKAELDIPDADFKVINASDDNSVDTVRNSVKGFAQTMPMGDFKIVFLDEADYLTQNAQAALRRMMEEFSDSVRFILTCNKPHKIIPELKSRCKEFTFNEFDKEGMAVHAYSILKKEGVKLHEKDVQILKDYVEDAYPDMRKLLMNMEGNVRDGVLYEAFESTDKDKALVGMIEQLNKGKWLDVREGIVQSVENDEWEDIYRFFYDNLDQVEGFDGNTKNWMKGIILIAEHLRFHGQVADPEINFSAFMIKLSGVVE